MAVVKTSSGRVIATSGGRVSVGNCGTGAGGFKQGNTCAKGGGGVPEHGTANPEVSDAVQGAIADVAEDFPQVRTWVTGIDYEKSGSGALMEFDEFTGNIQVPKVYANKPLAELDRDFYGGTESLANDFRSTVTHEIGHAIDRTTTVGLKHLPELQTEYIDAVDALRDKVGNPSKLAEMNRREFAAEQFLKERRAGGKGELHDLFKKYAPKVKPPKRKKK
jgi:hypothetical protein